MKRNYNLISSIYSGVYLFLLCGIIFAFLLIKDNYVTAIPRIFTINSLIYVLLAVPYIYLIANSNSSITNVISILLIFPMIVTNMMLSPIVLLAVTVAYIKRDSKKTITIIIHIIIHIIVLVLVVWFCCSALFALGDEFFGTDYEDVSYSPNYDYVIRVKHEYNEADNYYLTENKKLWLVLLDAYPIGEKLNVGSIAKEPEIVWLDDNTVTINGETVVVK